MANTTRGNLAAARIYEVDDKGQEAGGGVSVSCMFNPFEYTVTKANSFKEKPSNDADAPQSEFTQARCHRQLGAVLFFLHGRFARPWQD